MNKEYLDGQIVIESFGSEADETGRFRGGDERGEVAMIISNTNLNYVEMAEFANEGIKRGFHYHNEYVEYLYIIYGKIQIVALPVNNPEKKVEFTAEAGNIINIKPEIAHAFLSLEKSLVLSMGNGPSPFSDRQLFSDLPFSQNDKEN